MHKHGSAETHPCGGLYHDELGAQQAGLAYRPFVSALSEQEGTVGELWCSDPLSRRGVEPAGAIRLVWLRRLSELGQQNCSVGSSAISMRRRGLLDAKRQRGDCYDQWHCIYG